MCQSRVPGEQRQRELREDVSLVSIPGWLGWIFQRFMGEGAFTPRKDERQGAGSLDSPSPSFPLVVTLAASLFCAIRTQFVPTGVTFQCRWLTRGMVALSQPVLPFREGRPLGDVARRQVHITLMGEDRLPLFT